jgi:hypothetical protein
MRIALIWMLIKAANENDRVNMVGLSADAKRWLTQLSFDRCRMQTHGGMTSSLDGRNNCTLTLPAAIRREFSILKEGSLF